MGNTAFRTNFKRFIWFSLLGLICWMVTALSVVPAFIADVILAYLLSLLFVGSNFTVVRNIDNAQESKFYRHFLITLSLRFVLVIATLVLVLKVIKFHQIYFTVSFIISYIFHSVIEIISINKILETEN